MKIKMCEKPNSKGKLYTFIMKVSGNHSLSRLSNSMREGTSRHIVAFDWGKVSPTVAINV